MDLEFGKLLKTTSAVAIVTTFFLVTLAQTHIQLHWVSLEEDSIIRKTMDKWTNVQMGHQAQVDRSTRISAIEPSFRINDGLLLYSSEIMELGNLNGLIKLIHLETLLATTPTFQLKRSHFSSQIPCSKNSYL
jgi:hypothetical protein